MGCVYRHTLRRFVGTNVPAPALGFAGWNGETRVEPRPVADHELGRQDVAPRQRGYADAARPEATEHEFSRARPKLLTCSSAGDSTGARAIVMSRDFARERSISVKRSLHGGLALVKSTGPSTRRDG